MYQKNYRAQASYEYLKHIENLVNNAKSADNIIKIIREHGPKIGYKAVCYVMAGFKTPEQLKEK